MADQSKPDRPLSDVTPLRHAEPPRPPETEAPKATKKAKPGGRGAGAKGGGRRKPLKVVEVPPSGAPARMRRRHWGILFALVVSVMLPLGGVAWYLWTRAVDQYASSVGFTVRQEDTSSANAILGGLSTITGGPASLDANILYEFIQSQSLVAAIDARHDLASAYSAPHAQDPYFALAPDATIEDLTEYWSRMVRISYDEGSGLVELRVLAFEPQYARDIAQAILDQSQVLINQLNAAARADTIRYAEADLEEAVARVRAAREALTLFRTRTQIVDPETDIQGRMGVLNNLQQQLAASLVEYDLLIEGNENDPRAAQIEGRIGVIRERIAEERENFASDEVEVAGEDYPTLIAEYESLILDREFSEETYRAALAALDAARSAANRQTRYLAAYIEPTLPQVAEYPRRWTLLGLTALFLVLAWAIGSLIYYSIRDSR